MATRSSDDLDTDHTDELPVLNESVVFGGGADPSFAPARADHTDEHTAMYVTMPEEREDHAPKLVAELAAKAEQIPALEAQIQVLTDSARDLEQAVAARDRSIAELERALAELRGSADEAAQAGRHAAAQLAVRDGRITELTAALEHLRDEAAGRATELAELRSQAESTRAENEALRAENEALRAENEALRAENEALRTDRAARSAPGDPRADLDSLREENAALGAYIAGRRRWWDELKATEAALTTRVAALTSELESRDKRLAAADSLAARESERAVALRAELVDYARRTESLERELKLARGGEPASPRIEPQLADAVPAQKPIDDTTPPPSDVAANDAAADDAGTEASPPVLTDAVAAAPAVEAVAQLEAEVEYKRQQVAAQLVELRDRDRRLQTATSDLERLRRELGTLRAELDESRGTAARLERAIIDKDRALEARDARIATLQEELNTRLGAGERGTGLALATFDRSTLSRGAHDEPADGLAAPALLCLTGDAPKRFVITKNTVTVGRGPQCDLQILTHFVSREHARLVSHDGVTVIEDMGSRNGVFVNSVRVDRRHLRQGDLVTIGETQFRFVESVAH